MHEGGGRRRRRLVKSVRLRGGGGDGAASETTEPRWLSVDVRSAVEQWLRATPPRGRRKVRALEVVVRDAGASRGGRRRRRRRRYDTLSLLDGHDCCERPDNACEYAGQRRLSFIIIIIITPVTKEPSGLFRCSAHNGTFQLLYLYPNTNVNVSILRCIDILIFQLSCRVTRLTYCNFIFEILY